MKKTIICVKIAFVLALWGLVCVVQSAAADSLYAPEVLWARDIVHKTDPAAIADTHLGIPYRDDGTLDEKGNFTTFSRPDVILPTPGLNCSGLVLSVSRFLFGRNFTLAEAVRDRQGNSGPGARLGQDWDFGLDLVLNITEGAHRKVIMPDGKDYPLDNADGMTLRGFDFDDGSAWQQVLERMKPGRVYLGTISKPTRRPGYKLMHYHVVLMIPEDNDKVWLYHATRRSSVHKMNLKTRQGMSRLMAQFRNQRGEEKRILIVEAVLPSMKSSAGTVADAGTDSGSAPETSPEQPRLAANSTVDAVESLGSRGKKNEPLRTAPRVPLPDQERPDPYPPAHTAAAQQSTEPDLVVNHLSGTVYKSFPELVTHIPTFADQAKTGIKLWFRNEGDNVRRVEILTRGPEGELAYQGRLPGGGKELLVVYPRDFGRNSAGTVKQGRYVAQVKIDGADWCANLFEVAQPRESMPRIVTVQAPQTVPAGKNFTVKIVAENAGAESDYGGITVSAPDPNGLKLVAAKPGRIYPRGSTVLAVTSDRIKTKVPMAERWIELWGEKKPYDMEVQIQAGSPGTYPLYVRCALRGVNVKSNVVQMDPKSADTVDQQGFPVYVHTITVR
ncbi:MAG: hypothetical protein LDL33_00365 [Desulfomonile sp.]|nr:hypothetical protein [Desulfomonile sp.]